MTPVTVAAGRWAERDATIVAMREAGCTLAADPATESVEQGNAEEDLAGAPRQDADLNQPLGFCAKLLPEVTP